ncbi:selenophosphate synthase [Thermodesulforhabdus norvegica]|uniref:Selenide, water dikinase n=1 Tax=Thermodesulforhabdus norvegica TaxID=39841 RepID=A0A1I4V0T7_9BACT|nr:selenophosphate synthase [Thermodesulforhabdus norvegica]
MEPGVLAKLLADLSLQEDPRLLVGRETSDDAGVFKISDDLALVQTVDFFTPTVNDPYDFGRIAAANALSDVYAMGGKPITAMNIVCFPTKTLDLYYLKEILRGGLDKIREAGALLVGGHSVEDQEIKYGMAVTGVVHPERVVTNGGARPGDELVLTKPIGTGIITTALKGRLLSDDDDEVLEAVEWMASLNDKASEIMRQFDAGGCTDVTGFGLCGHAFEMAVASGVTVEIVSSKIPLLPGAYDFASMGMIPAGAYSNRDHFSCSVEVMPDVDPVLADLVMDPQTSGGLLISVPAGRGDELAERLRERGLLYASVIGRVKTYDGARVRVLK